MKPNENMYEKGMANLKKAMDTLGFEDLRQTQEEPLKSIFAGNDTLVVMPTGGGKSALFTIPTVALHLRTLVFCPTISLMMDQVDKLQKQGVKAMAINSTTQSMKPVALSLWVEGRLDVLYVAPERTDDKGFYKALLSAKPDMVVLDECHCLSDWGRTFRISYQDCGRMVADTRPWVTLALTATATQKTIDDVTSLLRMRNPKVFRYESKRPNLTLTSETTDRSTMEKRILSLCRSTDEKVIVFCARKANCDMLYDMLRAAGEDVTVYHGGVPDTLRTVNFKGFKGDTYRICVATNALAMGVDLPNIRLVIHADPVGSPEDLAQEVGRAGRDGKPSRCHMFGTQEGWDARFELVMESAPTARETLMMFNAFKGMADGNGVITQTVDEVGSQIAGMSKTAKQNASNFLVSLGVTRRDPAPKTWTVIINKSALENAPKLTPSMTKVLGFVPEIGLHSQVTDKGGEVYKEVSIDMLSEKVGVTPATVKSSLNEMAKAGLIDVVRPSRGKITTILRDMNEEDMKKVAQHRLGVLEKFNEVKKYVSMPDKDKMDFLASYFDN